MEALAHAALVRMETLPLAARGVEASAAKTKELEAELSNVRAASSPALDAVKADASKAHDQLSTLHGSLGDLAMSAHAQARDTPLTRSLALAPPSSITTAHRAPACPMLRRRARALGWRQSWVRHVRVFRNCATRSCCCTLW